MSPFIFRICYMQKLWLKLHQNCAFHRFRNVSVLAKKSSYTLFLPSASERFKFICEHETLYYIFYIKSTHFNHPEVHRSKLSGFPTFVSGFGLALSSFHHVSLSSLSLLFSLTPVLPPHSPHLSVDSHWGGSVGVISVGSSQSISRSKPLLPKRVWHSYTTMR